MKVFMLGWEFPPYISGGLGTACQGLTQGLDQVGVEIMFVLPMSVPEGTQSHVTFRTPTHLAASRRRTIETETQSATRKSFTMHVLPAILQPYSTPQQFEELVRQYRLKHKQTHTHTIEELVPTPGQSITPGPGGYGGDMMTQVQRYARLAVELAKHEKFDVVHAHDWMTYPAGLAVSATTGKPLVVHVHSTEFDRSGESVWQQVYDIERAGMHGADKVICVSHLTRNICINRYGVNPDKATVVYNAVNQGKAPNGELDFTPIARDEKIVLFLGRMTMQKGPEYFLLAAKKVLEKVQKVRFVLAGSGDLMGKAIEMTAALGIGKHVTFTGFLRGDDVAKVFRMADLYVMPSVSEPFGIAPLEALAHHVPVIISKQSGVSEVLTHVLKVDFWDVNEMANKILAVLRHPPLQRVLRQQGHIELRKLSWRDAAEKCKTVYEEVVSGAAAAGFSS